MAVFCAHRNSVTMMVSIETIWMFLKIVVGPQNGWFVIEKLIRMDDLGVPLFLETPIYCEQNIY